MVVNYLRRRLVVGISGASCSGKTTLTKLLKATFPWASVVHQDAYYHPNDAKYHVYLPDVKHFNWDLKSAVDFPRMEEDLEAVLRKKDTAGVNFNEQLLCCPNTNFVELHRPPAPEVDQLTASYSQIPLTLIEGHIIFNHSPFYKLCSLRYFLTLNQSELFTRRRERVYDPPNPPGYLEKYVWPAYHRRLEEVQRLKGIQYYDAKKTPLLTMYEEMRRGIEAEMEKRVVPPKSVTTEEGRAVDTERITRMSG